MNLYFPQFTETVQYLLAHNVMPSGIARCSWQVRSIQMKYHWRMSGCCSTRGLTQTIRMKMAIPHFMYGYVILPLLA